MSKISVCGLKSMLVVFAVAMTAQTSAMAAVAGGGGVETGGTGTAVVAGGGGVETGGTGSVISKLLSLVRQR